MRQVVLGRNKITRLILERAAQVMPDYGIELVDVQIQRINYVNDVQAKVFDRMISERKRIADRHRSEGQGKSAEIRGKKERELKVIESEAYRKAQEIMGRGDAEATAIYAAAYNRDRELYRFAAHPADLPRHHRQGQLARAVDQRRALPISARRRQAPRPTALMGARSPDRADGPVPAAGRGPHTRPPRRFAAGTSSWWGATIRTAIRAIPWGSWRASVWWRSTAPRGAVGPHASGRVRCGGCDGPAPPSSPGRPSRAGRRRSGTVIILVALGTLLLLRVAPHLGRLLAPLFARGGWLMLGLVLVLALVVLVVALRRGRGPR